MKLLVLSDLHNEFEPLEIDQAALANVDVVVLAGDIHTKDRSVGWAKKLAADLGKPAILVAGNHEFYNEHFDETLVKMRETAHGSDVHVLENETLVLDGVRFLGCTLWTDFKLFGTESSMELSVRKTMNKMNDFRYIRTAGYRRLHPNDTIRRHEQSRAWLISSLATPFDGKTVVVTHHAPSPRSIESKFSSDPLSPAFASDLEALMGPSVDLWVHGHMHVSFDYEVNGTRVLCNPRGYSPKYLNPTFDPTLAIEI